MPITETTPLEFQRALWRTLLVFGALVAAFVFYVLAEKEIDRVNQLRQRSVLLASELRQSSDDLTRMVRTYAVTGDEAYKQRFEEILAIRDGRSPRPQEAANVYWDLVLADGRRPRGFESAVPLLELMRQAGFTEAEFAKLSEAKRNSDELTHTEYAAMALLAGSGTPSAALRAQAVAMLHDGRYHRAKAEIMRPIGEFNRLVRERTDRAVTQAVRNASLLRLLFVSLGALLAFMIWRLYRQLQQTLGAPLDQVHGQIARLGRGDFVAALPAGALRKGSVMSWLAELRSRLQETETERHKGEARIQALAFYDPLTGLPNRTLVLDRLTQLLSSSARSGEHGALLFIDLDHFKTINDTEGHDAGDQWLKEVALRLQACLRDVDTVARFGGDEFVVLLASLAEDRAEAANDAELVAEKLLAAIKAPYALAGDSYQSSASIGLTLFVGDVAGVDELMKQADLAMYKAKGAGRDTVCFFDPALEVAVKDRLALEQDMRQALAQGLFELHYQPLVDVSGCTVGAECLLRWTDAQRGPVAPAEFIALAEANGLILPLGQWVLETACATLARWALRPELAALTLAVNVSVRQFQQADFVPQVLGLLERSGIKPERLKLELTESLLAHNLDDLIVKMTALKARGIGFSLDDFGTGYSSLSYLKLLPLDDLKVDASFVRDVLHDPSDAAIARTIVALARSLDLGVIAEGVETEAQRAFMAGIGCPQFQGWLFGRAQPLAQFEQGLG